MKNDSDRMPGMRMRKNGTWECRFSREGKRYSVYGKTAEECERKTKEKQAALKGETSVQNRQALSDEGVAGSEDGSLELKQREDAAAGPGSFFTMRDPEEITLDEYFEEFERFRRGIVKESTAINVRISYQAYISPEMGGRKVCEISRRDVKQLQYDLQKKVKPATVNLVISKLATILNYAVDDEILVRNPASRIRPLRSDIGDVTETIHRALTPEEQHVFMEEAKGEWLYCFYAFSLCTGMRLMEIGALTWADIDEEKSEIRVTKTYSRHEGPGYIVTTPKTHKGKRTIPMTETTRVIVQRQREQMRKRFGEEVLEKDHVAFTTYYGKIIASTTVRHAIDRVLERLEAKNIHMERFTHHAFRDTFATRYIEEGGSMQTLKTILGHSTLSMTMDLYAHVLPDTKLKEMRAVEGGFSDVAEILKDE